MSGTYIDAWGKSGTGSITAHGQDARAIGLTPSLKSYHPFRPVAIKATGRGEETGTGTVVSVVGLQEIVWVDSSCRRCSWGASPPAPHPRNPPGSPGRYDLRLTLTIESLFSRATRFFWVETQRQCLCIGASGRGGDWDPKSRVEPARIVSSNRLQPTRFPEAPFWVFRNLCGWIRLAESLVGGLRRQPPKPPGSPRKRSDKSRSVVQ